MNEDAERCARLLAGRAPTDFHSRGGPQRSLPDEAALRAEQAQLRAMKPRTVARAARLRTIQRQLAAIANRSPFK